ncbi:MAG: EamA family transporter [Acidimicrobiales bacterium]
MSGLSVVALSLVLGAAIIHALWNLGAKSASSEDPMAVTLLATCTSVVGVAPFVVFVAIHHEIRLSNEILTFLCGTAVLHTAYFLGLQFAYRNSAYTQVYPIARGMGPGFALVGAVLFLGESPTIEEVLGAVVLIGGVVLVGLSLQGPRIKINGHAIRSGGAIGVLIGTYTLWDAYAVQHLGVSPILEDWSASVGRALVLGAVVLASQRNVVPTLSRAWRPILLIGLGSSAAYLMVLFAYHSATVAQIAPLREIGVVVGVFVGGVFFREGGRSWRVIGAVVVVIGAALIAGVR